MRVAPRVCDPQVAAALLQPGEPDAATLPQLVHRFSESLPQLARAGGADARMLAHERCCLAAVRSQAAMVHLARLLQADGLTLTPTPNPNPEPQTLALALALALTLTLALALAQALALTRK